MAKVKNDLESVTITITTTPQVKQGLQALVQTGFFGKNPAEAAERLLASVVERELLSREPVGRQARAG